MSNTNGIQPFQNEQSQPIQNQPFQNQQNNFQMQQANFEKQSCKSCGKTMNGFHPDDSILLSEIIKHQIVNGFAVNLVAGPDIFFQFLCASCPCNGALKALDMNDGMGFQLDAEKFMKKTRDSKMCYAYEGLGCFAAQVLCICCSCFL